MSIDIDDQIDKGIRDAVRRLMVNEERAIFGMPPLGKDEPTPDYSQTFANASPSSPTLDWNTLKAQGDQLQAARLRYGIMPGDILFYRSSQYTPKTDIETGEPSFLFFEYGGYWLLHTDNVPVFRALLEKYDFKLVEMKPEDEFAPGWPKGESVKRLRNFDINKEI